jgi:hypothetical protein
LGWAKGPVRRYPSRALRLQGPAHGRLSPSSGLSHESLFYFSGVLDERMETEFRYEANGKRGSRQDSGNLKRRGQKEAREAENNGKRRRGSYLLHLRSWLCHLASGLRVSNDERLERQHRSLKSKHKLKVWRIESITL